MRSSCIPLALRLHSQRCFYDSVRASSWTPILLLQHAQQTLRLIRLIQRPNAQSLYVSSRSRVRDASTRAFSYSLLTALGLVTLSSSFLHVSHVANHPTPSLRSVDQSITYSTPCSTVWFFKRQDRKASSTLPTKDGGFPRSNPQ